MYFINYTLLLPARCESCSNVALTFDSVDLILKCNHSNVIIQMKATEQYFPVVLFVMLYKVVLTFDSVDEILKCNHSNESY